MINTTAKTLLNWIHSKQYNQDGDYGWELARQEARWCWEKYGEKTIKKALNHCQCTNIQKFKWLCNQMNKNK
jgi:hypothetical protein